MSREESLLIKYPGAAYAQADRKTSFSAAYGPFGSLFDRTVTPAAVLLITSQATCIATGELILSLISAIVKSSSLIVEKKTGEGSHRSLQTEFLEKSSLEKGEFVGALKISRWKYFGQTR